MFKYIRILIAAMAGVAILSCEKVVDLNLETGEERLVVEGRIEKILGQDNGYQHIDLSTTGPYLGSEVPPPVSNATVEVSDDLGGSWVLIESASIPSRYETNNLIAAVGRTYTLEVQYNGQTFQASETLRNVAAIDSIYQYFVEENEFEDEGLRARIDFSDPADEVNFYMWEQYMDGELQLLPDPGNKFNLIAKDEFYNGQRISGYEPNEEAVVEPGSTVTIRQLSLSEAAYDYFFLIFDQTAGADIFTPPPATIRGNIRNLTNADNYALGYFGASAVAEAVLVVR